MPKTGSYNVEVTLKYTNQQTIPQKNRASGVYNGLTIIFFNQSNRVRPSPVFHKTIITTAFGTLLNNSKEILREGGLHENAWNNHLDYLT